MDVERQACALAQRFDDDRADGEVRDEATVHHVDVELIRRAGLDARDIVGERGEIRGQDGRRDFHGFVIPHDVRARHPTRRNRTAVKPSVP